jgi:hypothetical protein
VADRLDRDGVSSQKAAMAMADDALKAFRLIERGSSFGNLMSSSLDGFGLQQDLERVIASYRVTLQIVADRVAYGTDKQLDNSLKSAEEDRAKVKQTLLSVFEYVGIPDPSDR